MQFLDTLHNCLFGNNVLEELFVETQMSFLYIYVTPLILVLVISGDRSNGQWVRPRERRNSRFALHVILTFHASATSLVPELHRGTHVTGHLFS